MLHESKNATGVKESVIYARVSSKEQEETGYSLPAQEKFLREYAERKDLNVTKAFSISESASGKRQREVFIEMMAYISKQGVKIIICEKVDRLTRNFKDAVMIDEWLEEDEERQVHLVKDSLVLHKNSRSQEKLNWGIRILFAKNYIDNLSEEVKKGLAEKLKQGWLPTKPPMGYKTIGEQGHKIHIIDETKAPLILNMFELYATGEYSLKKLIEVTHKDGLRTRSGRKMPKSRMASLLGDPFYMGKIRYNNTLHPGAHEPLVSQELFEKVQQVLNGKATPRFRKHFPLFKSLIHCAACGGSITWEVQKGHWYGHCNGYRGCTARKFVRQEAVEEQLLPHLDKITIKSDRLVDWIDKALTGSHQDQISYNKSSRDELNKRYEATQKRLEMLYDDKLDGKIPEDFYHRKYDQYAREKEEILRGLKRHDTASTQYHELGANILDLAHQAKDIFSNEQRTVEERRALVNLVFSGLTLQGSKINVSYNKAFELLSAVVPAWNDEFEPQKTLINKTKTGALTPVSAPMLPGWDEFRMTKWSDLFEDPELAMKQIQQLLNLSVQDIKLAV